MMTAAGTVPPARVFIMGVGVAGLQAIATAKRLGAVVSAYDVRPVVKEQVESLGAKFVEVDPEATAEAELRVNAEIMQALTEGRTPKGNVYETARIAGIQAAKRTSELIPLCHPIPVNHVDLTFHLDANQDSVTVDSTVRCSSRTGVERTRV